MQADVEAPPAFIFRSFVARADVYGVVAEEDGRVAGSNSPWEGDAIAAIGPITVEPAAQNESIGRELMRAVIERAARICRQSSTEIELNRRRHGRGGEAGRARGTRRAPGCSR